MSGQGNLLRMFPLQHKKMSQFSLRFLSVGVCEMMNCAEREYMSSFTVHNKFNRSAYAGINPLSSSSTIQSPLMADVVAAGLFDSYTGHSCSRFISKYLARALSMHSTLPEEIAWLRGELKDDPLVTVMTSSLSRSRAMHGTQIDKQGGNGDMHTIRPLFSEWDMQQYAMLADIAFLRACEDSKFESSLPATELANEGSRAVWFTATAAPFSLHEQRRCERSREEASHCGMAPPPLRSLDMPQVASESQRRASADGKVGKKSPKFAADEKEDFEREFCVDVLVSNVGDSRAFGIARNPLTWGQRSLLDSTRERVVPLSVDHKPLRTPEFQRIVSAGGEVRSEVGDMIDANPFYNVSRSFGHWSMKRNPKRAPSEQKITAVPTCSSWEMLPGDVLVLCNHAVFETRSQEDTSIDEAAKVVAREIKHGASPGEAAGALCDYALRFGAGHSLQVLVALATDGGEHCQQDKSGEPYRYDSVIPGPIYVQPCRHSLSYSAALLADCRRCGITLPDLLEKRWLHVRDELCSRYKLPLMYCYGKECSALQQQMEEEALLFSGVSFPPGKRELSELTEKELRCVREEFEKVARSIMPSKNRLPERKV
ncbi:protein phosphatase 2C, putative [Trypanosoma equiperdum]|uniref:Protein phosphatase 2C, putative n=2 Tax=Trypanozoon TaxID=39700 RepID=Q38B45_TRYB2|nr:protein phosphatase 2C, putative [Trypanosoma brucei brucei TREU927]EAN77975.1 protein phosphatase 2C, putative [Trypanosoma brucei brucei TREU927]SCU71615.1 protein phosphatase 2C, putative [Trypanosoma equiperdum]